MSNTDLENLCSCQHCMLLSNGCSSRGLPSVNPNCLVFFFWIKVDFIPQRQNLFGLSQPFSEGNIHSPEMLMKCPAVWHLNPLLLTQVTLSVQHFEQGLQLWSQLFNKDLPTLSKCQKMYIPVEWQLKKFFLLVFQKSI